MRFSLRVAALSAFPALLVAADTVNNPTVIKVCEVEIAKELLPTRHTKEFLMSGSGEEVEAHSSCARTEWIEPMEQIGHPFLAAAHRAFADHRPLAISPDMVWQLLVQMAAEEVLAQPQKYRDYFVDHEHGKRTLEVRRDEFVLGNEGNDWPGVFAELEGMVLATSSSPVLRDFSHSFSTSTGAEVAARRVVLLSAASPYNTYRVMTLCGIPRIELHGDADDWEWIRDQVVSLRKFNMTRRVDALKPVLDEFVAAARGKANADFWKSYYKFSSESGSSYISGWINLFFLGEDSKLLDLVMDEGFSWLAPPEQVKELGAKTLPLAMNTTVYRSKGAVDVDFTWNYLGRDIPMKWRAGFFGVSQDKSSRALRPEIGWQVIHSRYSAEETRIIDYLKKYKTLDHMLTEREIVRILTLDANTGEIRFRLPSDAFPDYKALLVKALPMMVNLSELNLKQLLPWRPYGEEIGEEILVQERAAVDAAMNATAVKILIVPKYLDGNLLRRLETRKDWEIQKR